MRSARLDRAGHRRPYALLSGDVADAVARLKEQPGTDVVVLGSGALLQSLMKAGLIDGYTLLTHPLVLGTGRRLFPKRSHLTHTAHHRLAGRASRVITAPATSSGARTTWRQVHRMTRQPASISR